MIVCMMTEKVSYIITKQYTNMHTCSGRTGAVFLLITIYNRIEIAP